MTSETYKKVMETLTDQEIYNFAERLCEHFKFEPLKQYPRTVDSEVLSGAARRILYIHRAINLLRRAILLGGTDIEVYNIAQYLVVLWNATEHKLDYRGCEKNLDISGLNQKYSEKSFLALDLNADDIQRAIDLYRHKKEEKQDENR